MSIYDYDEKAFMKLAKTFGSYSTDLSSGKNQQKRARVEHPSVKEEHPQSRIIAKLFNSNGWSREQTQKMINHSGF